jgi:hypothetical protein
MACFEEKPYFLRAEQLRNRLATEAIHKHSRMSAAGDREQDNADLQERLDKLAVASSLSAPSGKPRAHVFASAD